MSLAGSQPGSEPGAVSMSAVGWAERPTTYGAAEPTKKGVAMADSESAVARGAEEVPQEKVAADTSFINKKGK